MRVLVTGAGGQLGHDTVPACSAAGDDVLAVRSHASLDVTDRDQVLGAITSFAPDVVIHCAAWTAVDACEGDPDRALAANGLAVRWVAEALHAGRRAPGARSAPTTCSTARSIVRTTSGTSPTRRASTALAKLAGEREALALGAAAADRAHVVGVRRSTARTWCKTVHAAARRAAARCRSSTTRSATRRSPPTSRRCCAGSRSTGAAGVHHLTNQRAASWFEFAREVVAAMGKDPAMVAPITTADLQPPRPAPRPANSVLDNAVLRAAGIPLLRDYRDPLRETVTALS